MFSESRRLPDIVKNKETYTSIKDLEEVSNHVFLSPQHKAGESDLLNSSTIEKYLNEGF